MEETAAITIDMIKQASGKYDVESVFSLSLAGRGLVDLGGVDACINLLDIDVHDNQLVEAGPLAECKRIERVNLSSNRIHNLEGLSSIRTLAYLHAQDNRVRNLHDLNCLKGLPSLRALYLQNIDGSRPNPVCNVDGYRDYVLALCPDLDVLDGQRLRLANDFYKLTAAGAVAISHVKLEPSPIPPPTAGSLSPLRPVRPKDPNVLDEICNDLQGELNACMLLLDEVDTFLRDRSSAKSLQSRNE